MLTLNLFLAKYPDILPMVCLAKFIHRGLCDLRVATLPPLAWVQTGLFSLRPLTSQYQNYLLQNLNLSLLSSRTIVVLFNRGQTNDEYQIEIFMFAPTRVGEEWQPLGHINLDE